MKKVYKESVVLHEASDVGKINDEDSADEEEEDPKELELKAEDPRAKLNRSWTKLFKVGTWGVDIIQLFNAWAVDRPEYFSRGAGNSPVWSIARSQLILLTV